MEDESTVVNTESQPPPKSKTQQKKERAAAKKEKEKARRENNKPEQNWVEDVDRKNAAFEKYYEQQGLFNDQEEWNVFLASLQDDLPTTFRITGSRSTANDVNDIIKNEHVRNMVDIEYEGLKVEPPKQIPWYPGGLAWQLNIHKNIVRKVPEFKKLQSFLVYETEVGNISRQEAVSMLPPLVLDVEPHHRVLDMCAAPGSKTAQIIEAMHAENASGTHSTPSGLIIANDSDYKRAGMLVHQSSRLPSPALIVTNVDASYYPNIRIGGVDSTETLQFDRILADVPCSGDGTLRKNPIIWRQWHVGNAIGLHTLQLRILLRAMRMLAPRGRIVYSTCSLNPVENEAVIAAALNRNRGEYHLVDISDRLPQLIRRPGLSTWKTAVDKESALVGTFEDYVSAQSGSKKGSMKIVETMFPPKNASVLGLNRCWRIYPHLQNTGGFFVAVLERASPEVAIKRPPKRFKEDSETKDDERETKRQKLDEVVVDEEMTDPLPEQMEETTAEPLETESKPEPTKSKHVGSYKEEPYTYVKADNPLIQLCLSSIRVNNDFPTRNLFVRNDKAEVLRSVYLSNDLVRSVMTSNEPSKLRFISAGVKVVARQESTKEQQKFRVISDGIREVLPYMREGDIASGDLAVLKTLVGKAYPPIKDFKEPFKSTLEAWEFGHQIIRIEPGELGSARLSHSLVFPVWKSNISVSLMLDKRAKSALSLRLFGEDITKEAKTGKVIENEVEQKLVD